jgi:hypothetical protein
MNTDCLGNPVTLQDASSLGAVNDFVEGFIACEARAVNVLKISDTDHSPLVQAYCAALHMFAESRDAASNARPFIDRALASSSQGTAREQRFVACVDAWVNGDITRAAKLHEEQARKLPRDLVSIKLGQYHLFNLGDAPGMLRLALAALPQAGDVAYLHGMAAFAWEQCHLLDQAEIAARKGIALCRKEPWAHHALAHVMLTQGRISEGQAFMNEVSDTWTGLNSFMVTHNWWHQALFGLELGQHDDVLRLYDERVWGVAKDYSQDQVNAVSLLARLEFCGVYVGTRWRELGQYLKARVNDHVLPFLDLHYVYGLVRAEMPEAAALVRRMKDHALGRSHSEPVWEQLALPVAQGLLAYGKGDFVQAAVLLAQALPRLAAIGGSHAQRDLFDQIYLDSLMRSQQWPAAQQIVQQRLRGQPESLRMKRQGEKIYASLGLPISVASLT